MGIIVQKFGGTSVANAERIFNVAKIITRTYEKGENVVVVVSAQGSTTDKLVAKANEINKSASKRELDVLLSSGEQISIALLAMAIEKLGYPVISLLGWQAGVFTNAQYSSATLEKIDENRIKKELDKRNIVIVAGFQGINQYQDVTTLGRGGSDTSAVGIAAVLNADLCQIFTDVEGVYTADPRKVPSAFKLSYISYDEMLELATQGAQVLHNRSVEIAKRHNVELEVLSSMVKAPGTIIREANSVEKMLLSGVARDDNVAKITILGVPDVPGWAFKIFSKLSARNIKVDIILQSSSINERKEISFTIPRDKLEEAKEVLTKYCETMPETKILLDENVSKISIVGAGLESNPTVASRMFEALYRSDIEIKMIATSEIKLSVLINLCDADRAMIDIHDTFFTENKI